MSTEKFYKCGHIYQALYYAKCTSHEMEQLAMNHIYVSIITRKKTHLL